MKAQTATGGPAAAAVLLRERDAAVVLGLSISQIGAFRRQGLLTPIRVPGVRCVRYSRREVEALANRWISAAGVDVEDSGR
jgi:hypothetical protein